MIYQELGTNVTKIEFDGSVISFTDPDPQVEVHECIKDCLILMDGFLYKENHWDSKITVKEFEEILWHQTNTVAMKFHFRKSLETVKKWLNNYEKEHFGPLPGERWDNE